MFSAPSFRVYSGESQYTKKEGFFMKKEAKKYFFWGICFFVLFAVWTVSVTLVDVRSIGPNGSFVGFATVNGFVHDLVGVNMSLYTVTDWLGLVPLVVAAGYGVLGFVQLIRRKSIVKVDVSILALGIFYVAVMAAFFIFEEFVVNYRPVLINGVLEASYPSSTTLLVMCVSPTAVIELWGRIKYKGVCVITTVVASVFVVFMVVGRLVSGVHWITDIIGGALLSTGLVMIYCFALKQFED